MVAYCQHCVGEDEDISAKNIFNQYPVTSPCLECTMKCDIAIAKVICYLIMFMHLLSDMNTHLGESCCKAKININVFVSQSLL